MRFKPKSGEIYYTVALIYGEFKVVFFEWTLDIPDCNRYKDHNCFKTREEANKVMGKILKALR